MTPGQKHWVKNWEKVRERGQLRFVLITAARWGIFMGIFLNVFLAAIQHSGLSLDILREAFLTKSAVLRLAVWLAGGLCYALTMWYIQERDYRKLTSSM